MKIIDLKIAAFIVVFFCSKTLFCMKKEDFNPYQSQANLKTISVKVTFDSSVPIIRCGKDILIGIKYVRQDERQKEIIDKVNKIRKETINSSASFELKKEIIDKAHEIDMAYNLANEESFTIYLSKLEEDVRTPPIQNGIKIIYQLDENFYQYLDLVKNQQELGNSIGYNRIVLFFLAVAGGLILLNQFLSHQHIVSCILSLKGFFIE